MKRPTALIIFLMMLTVSGGCGNGQQASKPEPPIRIAVSFADINMDGNKIIKEVMEKRKQKDKIDFSWLDAENDQEKQAEQLEKLVDQEVKAVVLQPVDPSTGSDLIKKLVEKDIKVVALEAMPENVPVDAYVASDHELSGRLMAQFAIRTAQKAALGQKGQGQGQGDSRADGKISPENQLAGRLPMGAVYISSEIGNSSIKQITSAVRTTLQGSKEVQLLEELTLPDDKDGANSVLQQVVNKYGDSLQIIMASDSSLAVKVVEYLGDNGMSNRILTVGVGANEEAIKSLVKGEHDAEVDTRPDLLGQYSLDAAIDLVKNGHWQYSGNTVNSNYSVPSRITPVRIIEGENAYLLSQRGDNALKDEGSKSNQENPSDTEEDKGPDSSGKQQNQQQSSENKTTLRITTQDGKTVEMEIEGEVKKIESMGGKQGESSQSGQENGSQGEN